MNFSVVVSVLRETVGMFCRGSEKSCCAARGLEAASYVVYGGKGAVRSPDFAASITEAFEGLLLGSVFFTSDATTRSSYWRRHLVNQMSVYGQSAKRRISGLPKADIPM